MNKYEMVLKESSEINQQRMKERQDWEANNWRTTLELAAEFDRMEKEERKQRRLVNG